MLALVVAILALAFSVFAFLRQFGLQRRVTEIEDGETVLLEIAEDTGGRCNG